MNETTPLTAEEVVARQVREIRSRRGWTQTDLAERLKRIGAGLSQPVIAQIETGRRGLSLNDTLALAAALNVAPLHLFVPMSPKLSPEIRVASGLAVGVRDARAWVRGQQPLTSDEAPGFFGEVAEGEWYANQDPNLRRLLHWVYLLAAGVELQDHAQIGHAAVELKEALTDLEQAQGGRRLIEPPPDDFFAPVTTSAEGLTMEQLEAEIARRRSAEPVPPSDEYRPYEPDPQKRRATRRAAVEQSKEAKAAKRSKGAKR